LPHLTILGAGAAGALTAINVLREARRRGADLDVSIVAPEESVGRGTAFGTSDPLHLLNVPSTGMSALPEEPDHFDAWLAAQGITHPDGESLFASRRDYGRYLAELLEQEEAASAHLVTLHRVRALATAVRRDGARVRVETDRAGSLSADAVVVATGLPAAGDTWAPEALRAHERFVPDPWRAGALDALAQDTEDVLVVGAGLTMVDVVLTLLATPGAPVRRVRAVSRRGKLPEVHRARATAPEIPDVAHWGSTLAELREHATAHLARTEEATGDWRAGVDGLRYRIIELWERLGDADRNSFIAQHAGTWNELRHRMPPSSATSLESFEAKGRLTRAAAEVTDVEHLASGGLRVTTSDGATREVGWVVNCTGPRADVSTLGNPLLDDLLSPHDGPALATLATAGMGVRTRRGRLEDADGGIRAPVWTLGALRRGELWESTSVPEIRVQARELADHVLTHLERAAG